MKTDLKVKSCGSQEMEVIDWTGPQGNLSSKHSMRWKQPGINKSINCQKIHLGWPLTAGDSAVCTGNCILNIIQCLSLS